MQGQQQQQQQQAIGLASGQQQGISRDGNVVLKLNQVAPVNEVTPLSTVGKLTSLFGALSETTTNSG